VFVAARVRAVGRPLMVLSHLVCEVQPRVGHVEQHGAVGLLGGLRQAHAVFGELAIVGLSFHDDFHRFGRLSAVPIQPACTVPPVLAAGLCKIEHCGKVATAKGRLWLRDYFKIGH
jgi:hypothetical protein